MNRLPVKEIPLAPVVDKAPLNVVRSAPDTWLRLPAVIAAAVTLFALWMITLVGGEVAPTAPRATLPPPAIKAKLKAPSMVPSVRAPLPELKSTA